MEKIINLIVKGIHNNLRIDVYINKLRNDISRTGAKKLILDKKIKLNNKINQDPSKKIFEGDKISIEFKKHNEDKLVPYNFKLKIIYEDNHLLVIDKPAKITMHPGAGNTNKTIVNALVYYDKKNLSSVGDRLRPGIVHRIDKDTSGLIVVAKNNYTHEHLSKQFFDHSITRVYQALIWGKLRPQNGTIETFITRSMKNRQMMTASLHKGKRAITHYETLELFEGEKVPTFSLVQCKLETGRTHQIRVHLTYKGNNILGDLKYKKKFKKFKNIDKDLNNKLQNLDRQFLHAKQLGFDHPSSGERLEFSSNIPKDLDKILKKLRKLSE